MKITKKFLYKIIAILAIINFLICSTFISQVKAKTILAWPVPGHRPLSQGWHNGSAIDISDDSIYGATIVAAMEGTVILKYNCGLNHIDDGNYHWENKNMICDHYCNGFGTGLVIRGIDNRTYQYAHMIVNSIPNDIIEGTHVKAGQKIGQVGSTGMSSGPHLHFGITQNWEYYKPSGINPLNEEYNYNGDATLPKIEFAYIDEKSLNGSSYKVMVKASDENGIDKVVFRTFTTTKAGKNGNTNDDQVERNGTYNSKTGYYETTVYKSEHNNEDGLYLTEVYVWDKKGNFNHKVFEPIAINSVYTNLGEFEARIVLKYNTNYVIGKKDDNVVLREKNLKDDTQIWKFTKGDSGDYKITNKSSGLVMDVQGLKDVNGTNVILHTSNNQVNERFYIFRYNGGYRLSTRCSADLKGIDVPNLKLEDGHNITIGKTNSITNHAQTFIFEKIDERPTIAKGDINGEGKVNARDAKLALQYFNGNATLTKEEQARADVNGDGKINARDAKLILQIFNGK